MLKEGERPGRRAVRTMSQSPSAPVQSEGGDRGRLGEGCDPRASTPEWLSSLCATSASSERKTRPHSEQIASISSYSTYGIAYG